MPVAAFTQRVKDGLVAKERLCGLMQTGLCCLWITFSVDSPCTPSSRGELFAEEKRKQSPINDVNCLRKRYDNRANWALRRRFVLVYSGLVRIRILRRRIRCAGSGHARCRSIGRERALSE
jgi:hypothetical protein